MQHLEGVCSIRKLQGTYSSVDQSKEKINNKLGSKNTWFPIIPPFCY